MPAVAAAASHARHVALARVHFLCGSTEVLYEVSPGGSGLRRCFANIKAPPSSSAHLKLVFGLGSALLHNCVDCAEF